MNITKDQFYEYIKVQYSGDTNIYDVKKVIDNTTLTRAKIYTIMEKYNDLIIKYGIPEEYKEMDNIEIALMNKIEGQVELENKLQQSETELLSNPQFKTFLELQKSVNDKATELWSYIEEQMVENNIKSIKGYFGTVTIAERQGWDIEEDKLPSKFFKKTVDTKKITDTFRLTGKPPKGAHSKVTKYLTKRINRG